MKIAVSVVVNTKKSEIVEIGQDLTGMDFMRVKISKPPKHNQANNELVRIVAEHFGIKKQSVRISKGDRSKHKILEVSTINQ